MNKINPDYFLICSETFKHYNQLKYLVENFKKKIIFIEKPLFEKGYQLKLNKNIVFVGYNFNFTRGIIKFIKNFLKIKKKFCPQQFCVIHI